MADESGNESFVEIPPVFDEIAPASKEKGQQASVAVPEGNPSKSRSYNEMLETVNEIHDSVDKLQDRICTLHHNFTNLVLKAAFLFPPEMSKIINSTAGMGNLEISDPGKENGSKDEMEDRYQLVLQELNDRAPQQFNENENHIYAE